MSLAGSIKALLPPDLRDSLAVSRQSLRDLRERKVRSVQLYTTNRCNSRCVHCYVWQYKDHVDLPVAVIEKLLRSECLAPGNEICLEGGEFTQHPEYREILGLFADRQVCVITNGLLTDRIVDMADHFRISRVMVSLDGSRETYRRVRGLDAYERVLETIRQLKGRVEVVVNFTFVPWNDASDYRHVRGVCAELGVELGLPSLYTDQPYFKTIERPAAIAGKYEAVVTRDGHQRRYYDYHDAWLRGEKKLPCFSIFRSALVYPEGDVYFCHQRKALLGNLHERSFDEIWNSAASRVAQDTFLDCNDCWCSAHRLQDVYAEPLGRLVTLQRRVRDVLRGV